MNGGSREIRGSRENDLLTMLRFRYGQIPSPVLSNAQALVSALDPINTSRYAVSYWGHDSFR